MIVQISSLSTIMREYNALRSVGSLPFKDLILSATEKSLDCGNLEDRAWNISRPLMEFLESNHNSSQLEAIRVSIILEIRTVCLFVILCEKLIVSVKAI